MKFKTSQEEFWEGSFGDEYIDRNQSSQLIASNISLFSNVIRRSSGIQSIIEFGSNIGLNLVALNQLLPHVELSAVEINEKAINILRKWNKVKKIYHQSILDFETYY